MTEPTLLRNVQTELSAKGYRLFRNSVGLGYVGTVVDEACQHRLVKTRVEGVDVYTEAEMRRYVTLANARPIKFGLGVGSPDLVGWRRVVVTPEMVGRDIAVFVGIEGKTPGTRTTPEQRNFLQQIARWGGEAKIAREDGFEEVEAC